MDKINKYLNNIKKIVSNIPIDKEEFILKKENMSFFTQLKKFDYSGSDEKGEGEMKIFDLINELEKNDKITFYSPDSDILLLSMISKNNIQMLKHEKDETFSLVNINSLKESIITYCSERVSIDINQKKLNTFLSI
jgi:hypothetical protein